MKLFEVMSEKMYSWMKWLTTLILPAVSTFYVGLAQTFDLPIESQYVAGVLSGLSMIVGIILSWDRGSRKVDEDGVFDWKDVYMILTNVWYERFKWVVRKGLPGLIALLVTASTVVDISWISQMSAVLVMLNTALGAVLGISSAEYHRQKAIAKS